jgi:flagellar assembly protein FliH
VKEFVMSDNGIPPENVSSLINEVLKSKDPATVGLKRILRRKGDESSDYPLRDIRLQEFSVPGQENKIFNADERQVLELEKRVAELQVELRQQKGKASKAIQAAYTKGKSEGKAEGKQEGIAETIGSYEKKIDALRDEIATFLEDLEVSKRRVFRDAEHMLLELCGEIVRKIIGRELSEHDDVVLFTVKKALAHIGQKEKMVVRVASEDLDLVAQRKDFWTPVGERLSDISIEADPTVEKGGCIIDSNAGMVDARLGVQFNELHDLIGKIWDEIASADNADSIVFEE